MDDPIENLEEGLKRMVPPGLSDGGKTRLEEQIDALASGMERPSADGVGLRKVAAVAAVLVALAGMVIFGALRQRGEDPVASSKVAPPPEETEDFGIENLDFQREVMEDGRDGGIVFGSNNAPMRSHLYSVREMETVLDKETGLQVQILSERNEVVLTAVTSF